LDFETNFRNSLSIVIVGRVYLTISLAIAARYLAN
jgi:hypothetical protein